MRVVLDTNIVVSAFLWGGSPNDILVLAARGAIDLFFTEKLFIELADVLSRKKFRHRLQETEYTAEVIKDMYSQIVYMIQPVEFLEHPPVRDPDDEAVLAAAYAARAGFIVTGDNDLLVLNHFDTIRIFTPAQFLDIFRSVT